MCISEATRARVGARPFSLARRVSRMFRHRLLVAYAALFERWEPDVDRCSIAFFEDQEARRG